MRGMHGVRACAAQMRLGARVRVRFVRRASAARFLGTRRRTFGERLFDHVQDDAFGAGQMLDRHGTSGARVALAACLQDGRVLVLESGRIGEQRALESLVAFHLSAQFADRLQLPSIAARLN